MTQTRSCILIFGGLALLLQCGTGCLGAQYRPLVKGGVSDGGCHWVEAVRSYYDASYELRSDTDSKLLWCCGPERDGACTEARFVENDDRQMKNPFHTGLPPMNSEASVAGGTVTVEGNEIGQFLGFGWNFGLGFGNGMTTNAMSEPGGDAHFDAEFPGFEFRLYPDDHFSFDFVWRIGNAAWANNEFSGHGPVTMEFLPHFHNGRKSVATGVVFGGFRGTDVKIVGFVARLGGETLNPEKTFGFGMHFRPAVTLTGAPGWDPEPGLELMLEFNWNFYVPRPTGL